MSVVNQVVIKKVDLKNFKEFQADMISYKNNAHKAEGRVKELEQALEAGDPVHAKELKKYKTENARLKPLVEKFMERQKQIWHWQWSEWIGADCRCPVCWEARK